MIIKIWLGTGCWNGLFVSHHSKTGGDQSVSCLRSCQENPPRKKENSGGFRPQETHHRKRKFRLLKPLKKKWENGIMGCWATPLDPGEWKRKGVRGWQYSYEMQLNSQTGHRKEVEKWDGLFTQHPLRCGGGRRRERVYIPLDGLSIPQEG